MIPASIAACWNAQENHRYPYLDRRVYGAFEYSVLTLAMVAKTNADGGATYC